MTAAHLQGRIPIGGVLVGWDGPTPPLPFVLRSLARLPRFAGHTIKPWCVLQHSCLCHLIALRWLQQGPELNERHARLPLQCLLHDFAECLIGDIPSPLKPPEFKAREHAWVEACARDWGLGELYGPDAWDAVHDVDEAALHIEGCAFAPDWPWKVLPERDLLEGVQAIPNEPASAWNPLEAWVLDIIREANRR